MWYGHVSRSSGLAKTILQGTVKGERRHSEKKWEDNIWEWTGLEFAKSQRVVKNRGKWRRLFVKSSVVSQRPPRLKGKRRSDEEVKKRVHVYVFIVCKWFNKILFLS